MLKSFLLTVSHITRETPNAISIHFPQPAVDRIWYRSGQYLTLRVAIGGSFHYRSYSISTVAGLDDTMAITVKRVTGGLVSNYLVETIQVGDQVEVSRPLGRFGIENSVKESRHLVLFGAGSGITPLFSILRSTLFQEPHSRVALFYANRSTEEILFLSELQTLQQRFPERFFLQHILSQPKENASFSYQQGRTQPKDIQAFLSQIAISTLAKSFYICGPEAWMQMISTTLRNENVPETHIFQERFSMAQEVQQAHLPADGPTSMVQIHWGEDQHKIKVSAGTTILDAARFQGLELPYSCKAGTCATCMAKLVSGKIKMANNEALLDFEVEQGKVLVCQAYPDSETVSIRIGW